MHAGKKYFLETLAQSLEGKGDRYWAQKVKGEHLSASDAQQKVASILRDQIRPKPKSTDFGAKAQEGLLSLEVYFESIPPTESQIEAVIEKSKTDYRAFQAVRMFAAQKICPNSPSIKNWQSNLALGLLISSTVLISPSPIGNVHRDMLIVSQVEQLKALGWNPTQNETTTDKDSGCGIVANAMTELDHPMTYSGVEKVWTKRHNLLKANYLKSLFEYALADV